MSGWQITLIVAAVLLLGLVLLPAFNRWQVRRMPADQQILLIMKQAKGLHYIRNVSGGKQGFLYYVKNKRKILVYLGCVGVVCGSLPRKTPLTAGTTRRSRHP